MQRQNITEKTDNKPRIHLYGLIVVILLIILVIGTHL